MLIAIIFISVTSLPPLPTELSAGLVMFASLVSHILRSSRLPLWLNITLAAVAFGVASLVAFWLMGGFTSGDAREIVYAFIFFAGALGLKEFYDLLNYLRDATSPLESRTDATRIEPVVRRASRDNQV